MKVYEIVKSTISKDDVHGMGHVLRVYKIASNMAKELGADLKVVKISALLHDIARGVENHAIEGGKIAKKILKDLGFDRIEDVVHVIESHSFSSGVKPKTLEAKIVSDADKIDALGYIGLYRVVCHGCSEGRTLEDTISHMENKLLKLPDLMYTDIGRRIALERVNVIEDFIRGLRGELVG